jgi:hypothetical protein
MMMYFGYWHDEDGIRCVIGNDGRSAGALCRLNVGRLRWLNPPTTIRGGIPCLSCIDGGGGLCSGIWVNDMTNRKHDCRA